MTNTAKESALCRNCKNWDKVVDFNNRCITKAKKEIIDDYEKEWKDGTPSSPDDMRARHLK